MDWGHSVEASLIAAISFGATLIACRLVRHLGVVDAPDGARKTKIDIGTIISKDCWASNPTL